ncbi:Arc family DNA-binding protein [Acinetobacter johnsonii]|uniref:Arc family DNA-binding protein n=1 Tax=Acinetobacter johnsonii TaxID=40214 RepID=UPI001B60A73D|nr:Arc family DNA-binding protein [Acinetobacter sp.]USI86817.1 Arc family DNA-binding protein [Acinetobacter johnsonii]
MARTDPQFNLRVPAELKQQVEEAAKLSGRSINAEAVYRLEQSFKNINKSLDDLSADELIYFIFNKLNSRGLHLTVEEVARIKK